MKFSKQVFLAAVGTLTALGTTAVAGNGHVDKAPTIEIQKVGDNGLRSMKVSETILSVEEVKYLDLGRKFIISEFGNDAEKWPLMVDFEAGTVQFVNKSDGGFGEILFSDLLPAQ